MKKITVFTVLWCGYCNGVEDNRVFLYRTKKDAEKALRDLYYASVLNIAEFDLLNNHANMEELFDIHEFLEGSHYYVEKSGIWERAEIDVTTV